MSHKLGQKLISCLTDNTSDRFKRAALRELLQGEHRESLLYYLRSNPQAYELLNKEDCKLLIKALVEPIKLPKEEVILPEKSYTSDELYKVYDLRSTLCNITQLTAPLGRLYWVLPSKASHRESRTHMIFEESDGELFLSVSAIAYAYTKDTDTRSFSRVHSDVLHHITNHSSESLFIRKRHFFSGDLLNKVSEMFFQHLKNDRV